MMPIKDPAPDVRDLCIRSPVGPRGLAVQVLSVGLLSDCMEVPALIYGVHHAPVTGRRRRRTEEGRRMSARNLKRSSSLSRSASCTGHAHVNWVPGARAPTVG